VEPLYTMEDAERTLSLFRLRCKYDVPVEVDEGIRVTFRDAGHILGSAFLEMEIGHNEKSLRVIVSGDLGNFDKPIIRDPEPVRMEDPDYVLIESTYGNRNHRLMDESLEEFKIAIQKTIRRGGNVIIPSFALERAQDIIYFLREFYDRGELPKCQVFLDSPLAISAVQVFKRHPECFDEETLALLRRKEDPLKLPGLKLTRSAKSSTDINYIERGAIIIAASGMCQSGRIKHHLKHNLWRKECSVVFVGYQAHGTLGRAIVDGKDRVNIYGEEVAVRARIHTINGLSAHADRYGLLKWTKTIEGDPRFFVVHGEEKQSKALEVALEKKGRRAHVAELEETVEL
jgi:metallo-beta-lactamase family protein